MADIVNQIHGKIRTLGLAELGSEWQYMRKVFDPTQNDLRGSEKAYGVLHGGATDTAGILKHYTVDQDFELLLMCSLANLSDDADIQVEINDIYDQIDELFKLFLASKLELPAIVLNVDTQSISQPEVLDNNAVLIRAAINVKYRSLLDQI